MRHVVSCVLFLAVPAVRGSITFKVSTVDPLPLGTQDVVSSADELFRRSCPEEVADMKAPEDTLILSSYSETNDKPGVNVVSNTYASSNSFTRGSIVAWANHQSLALRPDVIWFDILAQLHFYMARPKNAESLRHLFVGSDGKKDMAVQGVSWKNVVSAFGVEMQKRVKTDWLVPWMTPGFSTSTENDNVTASVMMMGLTQRYFQFAGEIVCGIPEVTLLGTKDDWVKLYNKLDHLQDFGQEPTEFAKKLKPILSRFVQTWDEPESPATRSFWSQIVRAKQKSDCGPAQYVISGWITGFMFWRADGTPRAESAATPADGAFTQLDDVQYSPLRADQVPVGYTKAPLRLLDFPQPNVSTNAYVLAGNVGIKRTESGNKAVLAEPLTSWFLYAPVDLKIKTGPDYGNFSDMEGLGKTLEMYCPASGMDG